MNKQLCLLIQLSDLDSHLKELNMERIKNTEEEIGFKLQVKEEEIKKMREDIRKKINEKNLSLYDKILKRYKYRAVSQVVNNVCYGCFMTLPTEFKSKNNKNEEIETCPNCGRILYWIE